MLSDPRGYSVRLLQNIRAHGGVGESSLTAYISRRSTREAVILLRLKGKVAIVTGSSSGIGKATALQFVKEGAKVVVVGRSNRVFDVQKEIIEKGGEALAIQCDVSVKEEVDAAVKKTVNEFGRIDVLVSNAGIRGPRKLFLDVTEEEWDKTIDTNLKGLFYFSKAVLPIMIKQRSGKIVSVSSNAGIRNCWPRASDYCVSKAGIYALTMALASEYGEYGININSVAPVNILTPMLLKPGEKQVHNLKWRQEAPPLKRIGLPEDVAKVIVFLSTDDASYIHGEIINVDGGIWHRA